MLPIAPYKDYCFVCTKGHKYIMIKLSTTTRKKVTNVGFVVRSVLRRIINLQKAARNKREKMQLK